MVFFLIWVMITSHCMDFLMEPFRSPAILSTGLTKESEAAGGLVIFRKTSRSFTGKGGILRENSSMRRICDASIRDYEAWHHAGLFLFVHGRDMDTWEGEPLPYDTDVRAGFPRPCEMSRL